MLGSLAKKRDCSRNLFALIEDPLQLLQRLVSSRNQEYGTVPFLYFVTQTALLLALDASHSGL